MRSIILLGLATVHLVAAVSAAHAQATISRGTTLVVATVAAPSGVVVNTVAEGAQVSWTGVQGATAYQVFRGADSVNVTPWGAAGTTTSIVDGSLAPGSIVYYRVAAIYPNGAQGVSGAVAHQAPQARFTRSSGTSLGGATLTLAAPNRAPPAGVTVSPVVPMVARLSWPAITGAVNYAVTRTDASGAVVHRTPANFTLTSLVDTVPDARQAYAYRVSVFFPDNGHGQSAPVSFTSPPLANPGWMRATVVTGAPTSVDLAWETRPGAIGYWVRGPGLANGAAVVPGGGVRPLGLGPGLHNWRVTAVYAENAMDTVSSPSASAIVRVLPSHSGLFLSRPAGNGDYSTAVLHSNALCGNGAPACNSASFDQTLAALGADRWPPSITYANVFDLNRPYRQTFCQSFQVSPPFKQSFKRTVCWTEHAQLPGFCSQPVNSRYSCPATSARAPLSMIVIEPAGAQFLMFDPAAEQGGCDDVWCWFGFRQTLVANLDGEGNKLVPFACMSCHGGVYDPQTQLVRGATLLPIDPSLVKMQGGDPRVANAIIYESNPSLAVRRYIHGLYGGQVHTAGAAAVQSYVPQSWQQTNRNFYLDVVRKNCVMCHLAGPPNLDFTTQTNFFGNAARVHASVCVQRTMPDAEVPFKRFWTEDTGNIYVPGLLATLLGYPAC